METKDFLKKLCSTPSVSGHEYKLREFLSKEFSNVCEEISSDSLGNLTAIKRGQEGKIKIMLAAHMDEIGLMVKDIDEKGFIRFTSIGGVDPRTLYSQDVIIHGQEEVFGTIGAVPSHAENDSKKGKAVKMDDYFIDTGLSIEKVKELVSVGDVINIDVQLEELEGDMVTSRALDDKAGIAVMYECAKQLKKIKHDADVYFVSTVQEEVGTRGAKISTYKIDPDIGIAVDVGFGATPELKKEDIIDLSKGPGLTLGSNIHPGLRKKMKEVAKDWNIDVQTEFAPGSSGTDASAMQITKAGVPCLLLSVPLRYMHTSVETIDMSDIKSAAKLIAAFISEINSENLEGFLCY